MGGLSKKAYQLDKIRTESVMPLLTLDAGALIFKKNNLSPVLLAQGKATAKGIVEAYNLMEYDAVGIAPQDLVAGVDFLQEMQKQSHFPWLSANFIDQATGKPVFKPSLIKEIGSVKVGIIGITSLEANGLLQPEAAAKVVPWQDKLPLLATELAKQSDLLILLSSLTLAENQKIAETIPEIHLIFQSGTLTTNLEPKRINKSLIMQSEKQGKYYGILQISWHSSATWHDNKTKILLQKKNTMDRLNWRLNRYRRKGDPEQLYQNIPEKLATYRKLVTQHTELQNEINQLEAAIEQEQQNGVGASTFTNEFYAMETTLPDQPEILQLVAETTEEVNRIGMQSVSALTTDGKASKTNYPENFVGAATCSSCHHDQEQKWKTTRHARAYQTLVKLNKQYNLNCVPCHVTGVITSQETSALSLPPDMQKVGCEACHGAGKQHIENPEQWPLPRRPAEKVCLQCHTPDQDDSFDYMTDIQRLGCVGLPAH